jgi:hypothetical protein
MNDFYNLLNTVCVTPTGIKVKSIAFYDEFGYPVYDPQSLSPVSQKAKSIIHGIPFFERKELNKYVSLRDPANCAFSYSKTLELIQVADDIESLPNKIWTQKKTIFARPCPISPRHGFVDSRVISSRKQLEDLLIEVKAADSKGEIILAPFIEAEYSAVLCSNGFLSVGPGHDGATSGTNSIAFPVAPVIISNKVRFASGLSSKSTIFIEGVIKKDPPRNANIAAYPKTFYVTQLRGGPNINVMNDFIPSDLVVKKIVVPHNNLLKWESDVKDFKAGTVVYGKGHTLTSHAAIHCVINKIPFITSFEPKINQSLKPSSQDKFIFNKESFLKGVHVGLYGNINKRKMLHFAAIVLHNWTYLRCSEHSSWLLGIAACYTTRILAALSYGEYRHCNKKTVKLKNIASHKTRQSVYSSVLDPSTFSLYIKNAYKIKKDFLNKDKFRRGFGGKTWSEAIKHSIIMWNAIIDLQNSKVSSTIKINKLISLINKSVNLVHNNGWLFNKISDQNTMKKIADMPGMSAFELADVFHINFCRVQSVKKIKSYLKVQVN